MAKKETWKKKRRKILVSLEQIAKLNQRLKAHEIALNRSALVSISDLTGEIIYVNDKLCEVSQYRREELLGQNHRMLSSGHHPSSYFAQLWGTVSAGKVWRGEILNQGKNGLLYWADTVIAPILDHQGRSYQYYTIGFDISERKK
ncbi:MAG: PAS domain-containing protein [Bacteroidia bacterium]|nr:PAS domain-containing protein [Bacteroidia bacterium]